jgi:hypothetical protein
MRLLLFLLVVLMPLMARAQELTVFAAASLTDAMKDVSVQWVKEGHQALRMSFGKICSATTSFSWFRRTSRDRLPSVRGSIWPACWAPADVSRWAIRHMCRLVYTPNKP